MHRIQNKNTVMANADGRREQSCGEDSLFTVMRTFYKYVQ